ncbi:hypothetical protein B0H10DRAFT_1970592 [Mycena sp. CBHHK59/15]|nr:hypothetical protein B0H10DRAFT_1970592 [Mycena sp. CBHHK59/15]
MDIGPSEWNSRYLYLVQAGPPSHQRVCSHLPLVSRAATPVTSRARPARPISAASAPSRHPPRPSPHPASRPSPSSAAPHVATTTAQPLTPHQPHTQGRTRARLYGVLGSRLCRASPGVAKLDRRGGRRKLNRRARTQPSDVARAAATARIHVVRTSRSIRGVANTAPITTPPLPQPTSHTPRGIPTRPRVPNRTCRHRTCAALRARDAAGRRRVGMEDGSQPEACAAASRLGGVGKRRGSWIESGRPRLDTPSSAPRTSHVRTTPRPRIHSPHPHAIAIRRVRLSENGSWARRTASEAESRCGGGARRLRRACAARPGTVRGVRTRALPVFGREERGARVLWSRTRGVRLALPSLDLRADERGEPDVVMQLLYRSRIRSAGANSRLALRVRLSIFGIAGANTPRTPTKFIDLKVDS